METPLIILGVVAVFVVIAALVIVFNVYERRRTEQLRQIAEDLSFQFLGENDGDLLAHLGDFNLFSQGRSRKLKNLLVGTSSDTEVAIFDYQYTTGSGKNSQTHRQTVIRFQSERLHTSGF